MHKLNNGHIPFLGVLQLTLFPPDQHVLLILANRLTDLQKQLWNCIRQLKFPTGGLLFHKFTICPQPHRSDVTASIIFTICTDLFCKWMFNLSLVSFTVIMTVCYYPWNCVNTSNSISFHYKWQSRQLSNPLVIRHQRMRFNFLFAFLFT